MERSKEYEPLILDLQKSKMVPRSRRNLFLSVLAVVVVVGTVAILAALYYPKPTPDGQESIPATPTPLPTPLPTATIAATARPIPTATTLPAVKKPDPTPKRAEPTPTAAPTAIAPTATAPEALGTLNLDSIPADAEVVIDGKAIGRTPLRDYACKAGTYTVKFAHQGRVSEQKITVTAGQTTEFTYRFEGFGSIQIQTTRSGSEIFVNGEFVGLSPYLLEGLEAGTYTIVARRSGYALAEKIVALAQGEQQEVLLTMRPLDLGHERLRTPFTPRPERPSDRLHR